MQEINGQGNGLLPNGYGKRNSETHFAHIVCFQHNPVNQAELSHKNPYTYLSIIKILLNL